MFKKVLNISLWALSIGVIVFLLGFTRSGNMAVECTGVTINIDRGDDNYFVLEEDITALISNLGYMVEGDVLSSVDLNQIERLLLKNPAIKQANVYSTIDGHITVDAVQRRPIIRVFNRNGESYYIDENGWPMPLSPKYTARVMVASGYIQETFALRYGINVGTMEQFNDSLASSKKLDDLFRVATFVDNDEFWKAQVTQIYVNEQGDMELIPRVGNHTIVFGDASDLEGKFDRLMVFYEQGLPKTGWNEYEIINLKYKNQVVCKKR